MNTNKTLIFYLFHDQYELTENRLIYLSKLNPNSSIVACYGGTKDDFPMMTTLFNKYLRPLTSERQIDITLSMVKEPWYNIDLIPIDWFVRHGQEYDFDTLIYIEYDVLSLAPLDKLCPRGSFDFLAPLVTNSNQKWDWYWLYTTEHERFLNWRERHYMLTRAEPTLISFMPIYFISRNAIDTYANLYVEGVLPSVYAEIRLPNILYLTGHKLETLICSPTVRWEREYNSLAVQQLMTDLTYNYPELPLVFHPFYEFWPL